MSLPPRFDPDDHDSVVFTRHEPDDPERPFIEPGKAPGGVVCQTIIDGVMEIEQCLSAGMFDGDRDDVLEMMADYSGQRARDAWERGHRVDLCVFDGDDGRAMFVYRLTP